LPPHSSLGEPKRAPGGGSGPLPLLGEAASLADTGRLRPRSRSKGDNSRAAGRTVALRRTVQGEGSAVRVLPHGPRGHASKRNWTTSSERPCCAATSSGRCPAFVFSSRARGFVGTRGIERPRASRACETAGWGGSDPSTPGIGRAGSPLPTRRLLPTRYRTTSGGELQRRASSTGSTLPPPPTPPLPA
jgi:hypothetical protein